MQEIKLGRKFFDEVTVGTICGAIVAGLVVYDLANRIIEWLFR